MEIPCVGNNGIYIEEKGGRAGPFCAKKKMPAFVSRDVFFDIHIIVDTPLEVSFWTFCAFELSGYEFPKLSNLEHVVVEEKQGVSYESNFYKIYLVSYYSYIIRMNFN